LILLEKNGNIFLKREIKENGLSTETERVAKAEDTKTRMSLRIGVFTSVLSLVFSKSLSVLTRRDIN
jgi:hypothetical protein